MFKRIFGEFTESFNLEDRFFEINPETGQKEWFERTNTDCGYCAAPGFECDNITNCRYAPTTKEAWDYINSRGSHKSSKSKYF